jgi:hypothetical protein
MGSMIRRSAFKAVSLCTGVAALLALSACAVLSDLPEQQVESLINVAPEKAVLVGRIELQPPLRENEQILKTARGEEFRNAFILYAGGRLKDFNAGPPDTFEGSFITNLGREFFIKVDKGRTLYISGGMFYTVYDPPYRIESHVVSTPFQVEIGPDDEAVYIGTIQLVRDDRNTITSVLIRDDYQWADDKYKSRFGTRKTLRKALVAPVVFPTGN